MHFVNMVGIEKIAEVWMYLNMVYRGVHRNLVLSHHKTPIGVHVFSKQLHFKKATQL